VCSPIFVRRVFARIAYKVFSNAKYNDPATTT